MPRSITTEEIHRLRSGMWLSLDNRMVKIVTVTRLGTGQVASVSGAYDDGTPVLFRNVGDGRGLHLSAVAYHGWVRPAWAAR